MTIERNEGKWYLFCDLCARDAPRAFDSFIQAQEYRKAHRWITERVNNRIWHVCDECRKRCDIGRWGANTPHHILPDEG